MFSSSQLWPVSLWKKKGKLNFSKGKKYHIYDIMNMIYYHKVVVATLLSWYKISYHERCTSCNYFVIIDHKVQFWFHLTIYLLCPLHYFFVTVKITAHLMTAQLICEHFLLSVCLCLWYNKNPIRSRGLDTFARHCIYCHSFILLS